MAIAFVQSAVNNAGVGGLAYGSNNAGGNFLLTIQSSDAGTGVPSDTQGNTWIKALTGTHTGIGIYYAMNCKAGANTVTQHSASNPWPFSIYEFSGVALTTALDQTNDSSTLTGATITTTAPGDLIITSNLSDSTVNYPVINVPAGWTTGQDQQILKSTTYYAWQDAYRVQIAAGAIGTTGFSLAGSPASTNFGSIMASFFAAFVPGTGNQTFTFTGLIW
jgi:hypothetical protein